MTPATTPPAREADDRNPSGLRYGQRCHVAGLAGSSDTFLNQWREACFSCSPGTLHSPGSTRDRDCSHAVVVIPSAFLKHLQKEDADRKPEDSATCSIDAATPHAAAWHFPSGYELDKACSSARECADVLQVLSAARRPQGMWAPPPLLRRAPTSPGNAGGSGDKAAPVNPLPNVRFRRTPFFDKNQLLARSAG